MQSYRVLRLKVKKTCRLVTALDTRDLLQQGAVHACLFVVHHATQLLLLLDNKVA